MKKTSVHTISTSQVMSAVAERFSDLPKKVTRELIGQFLEQIEQNVVQGNKVRLDKLGVIATKESAARKGRNPRTGEEISIPASKRVSFKVAKNLKEQITSR